MSEKPHHNCVAAPAGGARIGHLATRYGLPTFVADSAWRMPAFDAAYAAWRIRGIRDAIEATSGLAGTTGVYTFTAEDHLGLDLSAFRMLEIKGGKWTLVE